MFLQLLLLLLCLIAILSENFGPSPPMHSWLVSALLQPHQTAVSQFGKIPAHVFEEWGALAPASPMAARPLGFVGTRTSKAGPT